MIAGRAGQPSKSLDGIAAEQDRLECATLVLPCTWARGAHMRDFLFSMALISLGAAGCAYDFDNAESDWDAFMADNLTCEVVDDCVSLGSQCPFGCTIPVATAFETEAKAELDRLTSKLNQSGKDCDYDCAEMVLSCTNNRCEAGELPPN